VVEVGEGWYTGLSCRFQAWSSISTLDQEQCEMYGLISRYMWAYRAHGGQSVQAKVDVLKLLIFGCFELRVRIKSETSSSTSLKSRTISHKAHQYHRDHRNHNQTTTTFRFQASIQVFSQPSQRNKEIASRTSMAAPLAKQARGVYRSLLRASNTTFAGKFHLPNSPLESSTNTLSNRFDLQVISPPNLNSIP
jgi:hypothetical protein